MSAVLYAVACVLAAVACGLGLYAWLTREKDREPADAAFFHHQPSAEEYETVLARRVRERTERGRRADTVWATFAGPGAQTDGIVTARRPSRSEVEQWLGYVPSWQRAAVLPPPGGTRLVTRYAAAVERYRHGAGSLEELLAEMALLAAQHIRAVTEPLVLPAAAAPLALAGEVSA